MMIFEGIKYIGIFGMRSTSVEMMLLSMFVGTAGGVIMGFFCVWLINKGKFDTLFDVMGDELNDMIIKKDGSIRKRIHIKEKEEKK